MFINKCIKKVRIGGMKNEKYAFNDHQLNTVIKSFWGMWEN